MSPLVANVITVVILVAVVALAVRYLYKQKKKGVRCIGCSMAGECCKKKACEAKEQ